MSAEPAFYYDDDTNTISLHWRRGDDGLMLIICPDGSMSFSVREHGCSFTHNSHDVPLPSALSHRIKKFMQSKL